MEVINERNNNEIEHTVNNEMKNVENSIFGQVDNKFKDVWKNEKFFPLLKNRLEKVNADLKCLGFGRVIFFNEIGLDWKDWQCNTTLTLCVMPVTNLVDMVGSSTKEILRNRGFQAKEVYSPISINTNEDVVRNEFALYFPTRNLVILLVNPFYDNGLYDLCLNDIEVTNPIFMTEEEIWSRKLHTRFMQNFNQQRSRVDGQIADYKRNIEEYRNHYQSSLQNYNNARKLKVFLDKDESEVSEVVKDELKGLKAMPVVKKLLIRDNIYVNFGKVYITGKVRTGFKVDDESGAEVPIMETKKVYIGELEFTIGTDRIIVTNHDNPCDGHPHPHAENNRICFGRADTEIMKLLSELKLTKLVTLLYSWAFSYNEEDTYVKLQNFYDLEMEKNNDEQSELGEFNDNNY